MPDDTARCCGPETRQDVDRHVARMIRERRLELGLTQQQLAERSETIYQQVYRYERGLDRITAGRLHRIAEALGVGPAYFFEGLGAAPTAGQAEEVRTMLGLARDFTHLPSRRHQEAISGLARALNEG